MKPLKCVILSLALLPLPLAAQSLNDTHEMRWAPSGKTPSATWHYRGKSHQRTAGNCAAAAAPLHLSGKTIMHVAPSRSEACGAQLAADQRSDAIVAKD